MRHFPASLSIVDNALKVFSRFPCWQESRRKCKGSSYTLSKSLSKVTCYATCLATLVGSEAWKPYCRLSSEFEGGPNARDEFFDIRLICHCITHMKHVKSWDAHLQNGMAWHGTKSKAVTYCGLGAKCERTQKTVLHVSDKRAFLSSLTPGMLFRRLTCSIVVASWLLYKPTLATSTRATANKVDGQSVWSTVRPF